MKTNMKHTPGPWKRNGRTVSGPPTPLERIVAECGQSTSREIDEANARLIAAAPEMLEALNALMATLPPVASMRQVYRPGVYKAMVLAMKAAAKAEGRGGPVEREILHPKAEGRE